ncbi:DUF1471 domain-containing protein [Pectobacterium parvum]|uniref:DUF1471 domain-containing protein n=2 Tax=Pectobacterium parvum TaxID=2778550 RepID=A0AAP9IF27_9GAMM|nr:DUF1471 domain-containing protein [Pectobacterium parvum]QHQ23560.1 DUF1471 domain-containing protein [Pectobacterium parvum]
MLTKISLIYADRIQDCAVQIFGITINEIFSKAHLLKPCLSEKACLINYLSQYSSFPSLLYEVIFMFKKMILTALFILPFSGSVLAAQEVSTVNHNENHTLIRVAGGSSVDDVTQLLQEKAGRLGAKSFKVVSISGNDFLTGTAKIYK